MHLQLSPVHQKLFRGLNQRGKDFFQASQAETALASVQNGVDTVELSGSREVAESTTRTTARYGNGTKVVKSVEHQNLFQRVFGRKEVNYEFFNTKGIGGARFPSVYYDVSRRGGDTQIRTFNLHRDTVINGTNYPIQYSVNSDGEKVKRMAVEYPAATEVNNEAVQAGKQLFHKYKKVLDKVSEAVADVKNEAHYMKLEEPVKTSIGDFEMSVNWYTEECEHPTSIMGANDTHSIHYQAGSEEYESLQIIETATGKTQWVSTSNDPDGEVIHSYTYSDPRKRK